MTTLHSPDAVGTVTALRNLGLADHEIAASVRVVVGQRLVRRLCRRCRRRERVSDADRRWLASVGLPAAAAAADEAWVPVGCDDCRGLGYDGRVGVFEVWRLGGADYDRVLAHADERALRHQSVADGLRTLLADGYAKAEQGVTSLAELRAVSAAYPSGAASAG